MAAVIDIDGLGKTYRRHGRADHRALDGFDMLVEQGQIHGFLGPNGSGKTTTLRALLGLVRADAGTMRVLGRPIPRPCRRSRRTSAPSSKDAQFFANFTARRTLDLLATIGGIEHRRVGEVLDIVGLDDRADERIRGHSLGMKQRLAVATALLKSPKLLILDEPANGLDPSGVREMRDLMRNVVADGATVVLSSHILGEIQHICDAVTIIAHGRRVAYGPVADILPATMPPSCGSPSAIRSEPPRS